MSRYVVMAGWLDVPHLSAEQQQDMLASIPPFQRDARSKGIPQLGSGAIYPVPETEITCDDFVPPRWWPRCYGLDVGWNWTAFGHWARDPETGCCYLYHCKKLANMQASEVTRYILAVDGRMRGCIDPAAMGRSQTDGQALIDQYRDQGLDVIPAVNAVEAGLYEVWQRLVNGQIKIMRGAGEAMLSEYRVYQRDDKGRVVKGNDHLMDGGLRYPVMTFIAGNAQWTTLAPLRQSSEADAMWRNAQERERSVRSPLLSGV